MQIYNNIIEHTQGESFTLDLDVRYPNGNPYIISSELRHPYILFTIASTQYEQNKRYVMRHWLDTRDAANNELYPRFFQTVPNESLLNDPSVIDGESFRLWLLSQPLSIWGENGFTNEVYHLNNNTYWYGKKEEENITSHEYKCQVIVSFSHEETKAMTGQNYVYFIECIDGVDLNEFLLNSMVNNEVLVEVSFPNINITYDVVDGKVENIKVTELDDVGLTIDITQDNQKLYDILYYTDKTFVYGIDKNQPVVITDNAFNDVIVNNGVWKVVTNINGKGLNKWQTLSNK